MPSAARRALVSLISLVVAAVVLWASVPGVSGQSAVPATDAVPPSQWPSSSLAAPQIEAWPNAIRIFGPDRHQTSLAAALTLRGGAGFPFDTPDATGGTGRSLAEAAQWWGLGVCPRAVIVVASDSPADATTAAALSDPTNGSSEPYLRRVAAADPLFDPIGGYARVDNYAAPILLTASARSGATALSHAARLAAQDLRSGGCTSARQAVIVGGPAAVHPAAETELVSVGYSEVFRVSGATRYGTAAAVALSLGTSPPPEAADGCADPSVADGNAAMAFYANSVVEWRPRARECRLLGRTVVLAGGIDALAAGWWTSYWQVPVLLHDGSDELPAETANALSLLDVEHLIVLGGTGQISDAVAAQAAGFASAEVLRVAGADRYATSVAMAQQFGGWWASASPERFERSVFCLVASSGSGDAAQGWPDALSAGSWCGAASAPAAIDARYEVRRMAAPVKAAEPGLTVAARRHSDDLDDSSPPHPERSAVPILLVGAGADRLPGPVAGLLGQAFRVGYACREAVGGITPTGAADGDAYAAALNDRACPDPGFAVAFGGPAVISAQLVAQASSLVSGGLSAAAVPEPPDLVGAYAPHPTWPGRTHKALAAVRGIGAFVTQLAPDGTTFHRLALSDGAGRERAGSSDADVRWVCVPRGVYEGARWLIAEALPTVSPVREVDVPQLGWYVADARGVPTDAARGPGAPRLPNGDSGAGAALSSVEHRIGSPACMAVNVPSAGPLYLRAIGPQGRSSAPVGILADAYRRFALTESVEGISPQFSGLAGDADPASGGTTRWTFRNRRPSGEAQLPPRRAELTDALLSVKITRGTTATAPDVFTAQWSVSTERGTVSGIADGEARLVGRAWQLRGQSQLTEGSWLAAEYGQAPVPATGFRADAIVAGLGGDGYGAGGFAARIDLHGVGPDDDTTSWRLDAAVNAAPRPRN